MTVQIHQTTEIYRGRVFRMERENVTLQNGLTLNLDVIRHPGAAAIFPLKADDNVVMLRQYRHAVRRKIWEIPAGTLTPGETLEDCAKRELQEETGCIAGRLQGIGLITPVPGYSDERIHLFLAQDLRWAEQNPDADEILDVHEIAMDKLMEMARTGEIQDAKTLCALFFVQQMRTAGALG